MNTPPVESPILSIVIVNYNVKYFLEQTLLSVRKAITDIPVEIFVVDNDSKDKSVEMIKDKFPEITLLENQENKGFAKANNQALKLAKGKYVLLLNPDTNVQEDTFTKVLEFMNTHPEAGALGVKMIDGKGIFLRESKRSIPYPSVAFYKVFGFSKIFPHSKTFGKYHLGYLDENEVNEVEVLSGAFMLIRKEVLDKIGLLDEDYFMYGEDIDLSKRIIDAGYKNYYFPETKIIHYKGESTKKGSLNYVMMFYKAMIIFAKKHFSQQQAWLFSILINLAVYLRAVVALGSRFMKVIFVPALDFGILFAGMYVLKGLWEDTVKVNENLEYPPEFMMIGVPTCIIVWLGTIFFSGGYDKPVKLSKIILGIVVGTVLILAAYGLLNENWGFSRGLILLGTALAVIVIPLLRLIGHFLRYGNFRMDSGRNKRIVIVGKEEESNRVLNLLNQTQVDINFIGQVTTENEVPSSNNILGTIDQLQDITDTYGVKEIIFCGKDTGTQEIISAMSAIGTEVDYKIIPGESLSMIGSNSANTSGDLYAIDINMAISMAPARRNKRMLDLMGSMLLLLTLPVWLIVAKNKIGLVRNIFNVLFGNKTWVGYAPITEDVNNQNIELPFVKPGVLSPMDKMKNRTTNNATISRLNLLYAKDYSVWFDVNVILNRLSLLGNQ